MPERTLKVREGPPHAADGHTGCMPQAASEAGIAEGVVSLAATQPEAKIDVFI